MARHYLGRVADGLLAEALDGSVFHCRDKTCLEADAVIVLADGRWVPVEVELGEWQTDRCGRPAPTP